MWALPLVHQIFGKTAKPLPPSQIVIVDMWKEHTPAPFNSVCDSYSFLVRHGILWRITYGALQPRLIHMPYFVSGGVPLNN